MFRSPKIKAVLAFTGAAMIFLAQTKPTEAVSNVAGWSRLLHLDRFIDNVFVSNLDTLFTIVGSLIVVLSVGLWAWQISRKRRKPLRQMLPTIRQKIGSDFNMFSDDVSAPATPKILTEYAKVISSCGKLPIYDEDGTVVTDMSAISLVDNLYVLRSDIDKAVTLHNAFVKDNRLKQGRADGRRAGIRATGSNMTYLDNDIKNIDEGIVHTGDFGSFIRNKIKGK